LMMFWWCFDDVLMMFWWCFDDVPWFIKRMNKDE
jgi:hypothetical protein